MQNVIASQTLTIEHDPAVALLRCHSLILRNSHLTRRDLEEVWGRVHPVLEECDRLGPQGSGRLPDAEHGNVHPESGNVLHHYLCLQRRGLRDGLDYITHEIHNGTGTGQVLRYNTGSAIRAFFSRQSCILQFLMKPVVSHKIASWNFLQKIML